MCRLRWPVDSTLAGAGKLESSYYSVSLGVVGVAVIVWGSLVPLTELCRVELKRLSGTISCQSRNLVRQHYGFYLLSEL